jgi:cytochrome c
VDRRMKFARALGAAAGLGLAVVSSNTALAGPAGPDGATIFRQRCQSCHAIGSARPSTLGPSLTGVVGRKAGATDFKYSAALKGSGLTWSKANLDQFLAGPTRLVPGTRMVVSLPDPAQRAALIQYLSSVR